VDGGKTLLVSVDSRRSHSLAVSTFEEKVFLLTFTLQAQMDRRSNWRNPNFFKSQRESSFIFFVCLFVFVFFFPFFFTLNFQKKERKKERKKEKKRIPTPSAKQFHFALLLVFCD